MSDAPPLNWAFGRPDQRLAFRRYWIRDTLSGVWFMILNWALGLGSVRTCSWIGAFLAISASRINPEHDRRLKAAIVRLRPDLGPQLDKAALEAWASFGRTAAEYAVLPRIWKAKDTEVVGLEHLEAARATGRPRIFAGLHIGNAEVMGPKLFDLGEDPLHIYQPQPNRFRRRFTQRLHDLYPDRMLEPTPASALVAVRALAERGKSLIIYVDEFASGRVQTPALGRPLSCAGNLGRAVRLAHLSGALIVLGYGQRLPGARFRVVILPAMDVLKAADGSLRLKPTVRALEQVIEPLVLQHLEQWSMLPILARETMSSEG